MQKLLQPGVRMFSGAALLTALAGLVHFSGLRTEPPNESWATAMDAMQAATLEAGPFTVNFYRFFEGAWIEISVLLILLAAKNVAVVMALPSSSVASVVNKLALLDGCAYALLTVMFIYFEIPPPIINFAVLSLAFFLAARTANRATEPANSSNSI